MQMTQKQTDVTALVLAGGRGSRMGGVDKGLVDYLGKPLISHLLDRLAPQVAGIAINANRNIDQYRSYGWPVLSDSDPSAFDGPLAGMLAGLKHCTTDWLLTAPCDSPFVPADYAERMRSAVSETDSNVAMASNGHRHQPVFCLIRCDLAHSLHAFLSAGDRKIDLWTRAQNTVEVTFDEPDAFQNFNTEAELRANDTN